MADVYSLKQIKIFQAQFCKYREKFSRYPEIWGTDVEINMVAQIDKLTKRNKWKMIEKQRKKHAIIQARKMRKKLSYKPKTKAPCVKNIKYNLATFKLRQKISKLLDLSYEYSYVIFSGINRDARNIEYNRIDYSFCYSLLYGNNKFGRRNVTTLALAINDKSAKIDYANFIDASMKIEPQTPSWDINVSTGLFYFPVPEEMAEIWGKMSIASSHLFCFVTLRDDKSAHNTLIIIDIETSKWYWFDVNGITPAYYDKNHYVKNPAQLIHVFQKWIDDVCKYAFVGEHANTHFNYCSLVKKSIHSVPCGNEKGVCLSWSVYFGICVKYLKMSPHKILRKFLKWKNEYRQNLISICIVMLSRPIYA